MTRAHLDLRWLDGINIVAGHPALDFVNTLHSRVEPETRDYLETPGHLVGWCLHAGLVDKPVAARLARLSPARGGHLLAAARDLRRTLHGVFDGHLHGKPDRDALRHLDHLLEKHAGTRFLEPSADGYRWRCRVTDRHPASLLAPLVFLAADLLCSPELARLKACPPPEGCGWLFLDRSRNGSRTWCNMKTCGNLVKQRRHRARQARRS